MTVGRILEKERDYGGAMGAAHCARPFDTVFGRLLQRERERRNGKVLRPSPVRERPRIFRRWLPDSAIAPLRIPGRTLQDPDELQVSVAAAEYIVRKSPHPFMTALP